MGKIEQLARKKRATVKNAKRLDRQPKEPCDQCGELCYIKHLTEYDPFLEEVYNRKKKCHLCPACNRETCRDV